jgi:hypothetical protein
MPAVKAGIDFIADLTPIAQLASSNIVFISQKITQHKLLIPLFY